MGLTCNIYGPVMTEEKLCRTCSAASQRRQRIQEDQPCGVADGVGVTVGLVFAGVGVGTICKLKEPGAFKSGLGRVIPNGVGLGF